MPATIKPQLLTGPQIQTLDTLGYTKVLSCLSSNGYAAPGSSAGSHSHVWKVEKPPGPGEPEPATPMVAVAKFWKRGHAKLRVSQEAYLGAAAKANITCVPRVIASASNCTLMTLCEGVTLDHFAAGVAAAPQDYTVDGIERLIVGWTAAMHEFTKARLFNDDMHDGNVMVDYPRRLVWVIDPFKARSKHFSDDGRAVLRMLLRCAVVVAVHHTKSGPTKDIEWARDRPVEYVDWNQVS